MASDCNITDNVTIDEKLLSNVLMRTFHLFLTNHKNKRRKATVRIYLCASQQKLSSHIR